MYWNRSQTNGKHTIHSGRISLRHEIAEYVIQHKVNSCWSNAKPMAAISSGRSHVMYVISQSKSYDNLQLEVIHLVRN